MKKIHILKTGQNLIVTERYAANLIDAKLAVIYEEPEKKEVGSDIQKKEDKTTTETKDNKVAATRFTKRKR